VGEDDLPAYERPRWLKDFLRFLPLKAQFVLSGNVRDLQLVEIGGTLAAQSLVSTLAHELRKAGYPRTIYYDPVSGFRTLNLPGENADPELLTKVGLTPGQNGNAPAGLDGFSDAMQRIVSLPASEPPIGLIADFASRLVIRSSTLTPNEHQAFTRALILSHQAKAAPRGTAATPFFNTVVWIVEREGDLPDWLVVENPRIRHIPVPRPDNQVRRHFGGTLVRTFAGAAKASEGEAKEALDTLVDQTEGLLLMDLAAIAQLGRSEAIDLSAVGEAVRRYKVGVTEDPWSKIDTEKIRNGVNLIRARVKGQDHAAVHVLDILKRAITGIGSPRRGNRPRGVAFLAGPTGVGKTELAKTVTSLLFGDESAYIRFDMSEFSAEHSDQRLIGAPPGYAGYDMGGELTNAVREKPFSVVLFDEIEKAHPRILDKFLQVLDDGVLTSGRGDRVYFSETFVIFTSNLGIYRLDATGARIPNVTPDDAFADVQSRVRNEIEQHFKVTLNRPEILNRIGDNVLVFDFIRQDIAKQIFEGMVTSLLSDLARDKGMTIRLEGEARAALAELCLSDLSNGGRGIRNKVESNLTNPLARALFDGGHTSGAKLTIERLGRSETGVTEVVLRPLAGDAAA
jgi:ATP-dependent Clp protease ATP-binding subunit ClpA